MATAALDIEASGLLNQGDYQFQGRIIKVKEGTRFNLDMSLALNGRAQLDTNLAEGKLTLSQPIEIGNIPSPTAIELKGGQATVELDLARALLGLIVESLQHVSKKAEPSAHDSLPAALSPLLSLLKDLEIKRAHIKFMPEAPLSLPSFHTKCGVNSYWQLQNVKFTGPGEYSGDATVVLNELRDTHLEAGGLVYDAESCSISFSAKISAHDGTLHLSAGDSGKPFFRSSGNKIAYMPEAEGRLSSKQSLSAPGGSLALQCQNLSILMRKLNIQKSLGIGDQPSCDLESSATISGLKFALKSPGQTVEGTVPLPTQAQLLCKIPAVNEDGQAQTKQRPNDLSGKADRSIHLSIAETLSVSPLHWVIQKNNNQLDLVLRDVSVSNLAIGTTSGISLTMDSALLKPSQLLWHKKKSTFTVCSDPLTRLKFTQPFSITIDQGGKLSMSDRLPLSITSGAIRLSNNKHSITCSHLNGNCNFTLVPDAIKMNGRFSMALSGRDSSHALPALPDFEGNINSLTLAGDQNDLKIAVDKAAVLINRNDLLHAIRAAIPDPYIVNVDELLLAKQKWRYRNMKLKKVTLLHEKLNEMNFPKANQISLAGESDLKLEGTVEAYHQKFNPLAKEPSQWKEHSWLARAHVQESGLVDYKLIAGKSLAQSKLHLDGEVDVGVPQTIDFDWSKVAGDTLARAENALLQSGIKGASSIAGSKKAKINFSRDIALIKKPNHLLSIIKLNSFTVSPEQKQLLVTFSGEAEF